MTNLNRLAETAVNGLEKSMLGGVKKESAVKAIKNVAEEGSRQIEQLTQTVSSQSARITGLSQEVKEATQQLQNANASLAYTQGELATKDKALAEITEQLTKTKTKTGLSDAKATKKGVSKLKDGSIQEISVNKNGTRMKKITGANGNIKSYEVEQLDGSVRKTEFDSLSGKRVKTKTNTTGEEVTMDYDLAGKNTKVSAKTEPKPELIKRSKVDDNKIVEEFSDGSKVVRTQLQLSPNEYQKSIIKIEKFDNAGEKTELYKEIITEDGAKLTLHVNYGDDTVATKVCTTSDGLERIREKTISTNEFGETFVSQAKYKSEAGEIVYRPTQTDMMGNITKAESVATYNLPDNASYNRAKTVKTSFDIDNSSKFFGPRAIRTADTVITKDGSRIERLYDKEDRISQALGYDSKGVGNNYLKDNIRFGKEYNQEPLSTYNLSLNRDVENM